MLGRLRLETISYCRLSVIISIEFSMQDSGSCMWNRGDSRLIKIYDGLGYENFAHLNYGFFNTSNIRNSSLTLALIVALLFFMFFSDFILTSINLLESSLALIDPVLISRFSSSTTNIKCY